MICGLAAVAAAMVAAAGISTEGGLPYLLTSIVVSGAGLGCASVASTAAGVSAVSEEELGLASGLLNAAAQVGTAVGIAALVAVAAARTGVVSGGEPSSAALVEGYRWAFFVAVGLAVMGTLASLSLVRAKAGEDSAVSEEEPGEA
jgi:MFS family permease